jgi:hypothetical protein
MFLPFDIYLIYRRCQGRFRNSGYRLPKDWDTHFETKMIKENKNMLQILTGYFNTKWKDIDPEKYFTIGFELYGNRFSYRKFIDRKIILHYIQRDKLEKREIGEITDDIKESVKFVDKFVTESSKISKLLRYCSMKDGYLALPVIHYLDNKISKAFIVLLIKYGLFFPSDDEKAKIPYVLAHYNNIVTKFDSNILSLCRSIL